MKYLVGRHLKRPFYPLFRLLNTAAELKAINFGYLKPFQPATVGFSMG